MVHLKKYKYRNLVFIFILLYTIPISIHAKHKCLNGDCINGKGKASYPRGDVYTGDWKNGLAEGKGILEYANGNMYIGEWKKGFATGKGSKKYANGNFYQGEWSESKADGIGVLYDSFGKVIYSGIWKEGKFISSLSP